MPRQFGARDKSLLWPICPFCNQRHDPRAGCPGRNIWLVAAMCPHCTPLRYCGGHDAHAR